MPQTTRRPRTRSGLLASPGNSKLGGLVHSFSIPAGSTCPGRSERCSRLCYAGKGLFNMPSIVRKYEHSYRVSLTGAFVPRMVGEIRAGFARVVRIHVSGDYYSPEYVGKWIEIVDACPQVTFYHYTRSWRIPSMLPGLTTLGLRPNVFAWWSEDRETGDSPAVDGIRVAYMAHDNADDFAVPDHADLVFRTHNHRRINDPGVKRIRGVLVCPHEQDSAPTPLTCSRCQICFQDRKFEQRI